MPILHCHICDHEWEGRKGGLCDWCNGPSYVLAEETEFERFINLWRDGKIKILKTNYNIDRGSIKV